jgi:DNA polymerase-3 subunit alpha
VFQFDGSGYRALCRLMRPDKFADITALGALYRPGPMGTNTTTTTRCARTGSSPSRTSTPS